MTPRAEPPTWRNPQRWPVEHRFWALTTLLLVVALGGAVTVVHLHAGPALDRLQQQALAAQARSRARSLDATLIRYRDQLSGIAAQAPVADILVSGNAMPSAAERVLAAARTSGFRSVALLDRSGARLMRVAAPDVAPHAAPEPFPETALRDLAARAAAGHARDTVHQRHLHLGGLDHFLIAVPVPASGPVAGSIVAHLLLPVAGADPAGDQSVQARIVPRSVAAQSAHAGILAPLSSTDLAIAMLPDTTGMTAETQQLLQGVTWLLLAALCLPAGLFALAGRAFLLKPHRRLEAEHHATARLAAVAESASSAIMVTDLEGRTVWVNPAFERMSGFTLADMAGKPPGEVLQGPATDPVVQARLERAVQDRTPVEAEIVNYNASGQPFWLHIDISPLSNREGEVFGYLSVSQDITEAHHQRQAMLAAKREIEHNLRHDALTGLANRRSLDDALDAAAASHTAPVTILRIDLDHFRYVNETMGQEAGDHVLCHVADLLLSECGEGDHPFRVGADEFVVLLRPGADPSEGVSLAKRLKHSIRQPIPFESKTIRTGASFGIASTGDRFLPLAQILIGADCAMQAAKDAGRGSIRQYTAHLHKTVLDRRMLARDLRRAIAREEFEPYFQPQFDAVTRQIVGVETLVRWHSPELGIVMPGHFLPVAERLSAVNDIDRLIFRKAMKQIGDLHADGIDIPKISFNITAERMQDPTLLNHLRETLNRGPRVAFEILESVLVEEQSEQFVFGLDLLRELGVSIEIDDFGSGHASIIGLMRLRPDVMKIDQRLIFPLLESDITRGIVQQIIAMARLMDLKVTAEGVETLAHAELLQSMGCHTLQGFALAKPMTAGDLRHFAASHAEALATRSS